MRFYYSIFNKDKETKMSSQLSPHELPTNPIGGKPPAGSTPSIADLDCQVNYQRAFEAVLWSMPAIAIYGFHRCRP
ncbi:MAG TPA: hypothetical protein VLE70_15220 [Anaerolineae bacterium]|jgi:hypothetical protein|nr:hypothetical protein [Anaerolineae bacterium]